MAIAALDARPAFRRLVAVGPTGVSAPGARRDAARLATLAETRLLSAEAKADVWTCMIVGLRGLQVVAMPAMFDTLAR
jgi:hypothetical protein